MNSVFYTYLWLREDGTPYYVGKGCRNRAYTSCPGHRPPKDRSCIVVQGWANEQTFSTTQKENMRLAHLGKKHPHTPAWNEKIGQTMKARACTATK